ncbi:hypothetical protein BKA00_001683 [Actinomadura coerulea]|uniref:Flavodoxin family protein n=1 Tax=Actinomadura coerulea TaxID=46159 RepID=A0A7X0FWC7_9ACTN|nr:hypothetical protein [Actinomadura coerulea]MBB6394769.1 hypothetical protein [Actinomadura coerulea]GGQ32139.1 hypothetical protein GCM10010187_56430 [Actinomadura coerulea]
MRAVVINCTLKRSPETSNTGALAAVVEEALRERGVVVTGNEDGAHHVINNLSGALNEFGYTIPGQAWTYWNRGTGPGPSYLETEEGRDWSHSTGRAMASNLVAVASALAENPVPAPPS